jgi:hypothetical protein
LDKQKYTPDEFGHEIPCRVWLPNQQKTILVDLMCLPDEAKSFDVIVHALATKARYNGHTPWPYSVALHSVLVSLLMPDNSTPALEFEALLHDAAEAFVGDVIHPIKMKIAELYKPIENAVDEQLRHFYRLPLKESLGVKLADNKALWLEQFILQGKEIQLSYKLQLTARDFKIAEALIGKPVSFSATREIFLAHLGAVMSGSAS